MSESLFPARHVVQFSTGIGSAEVLRRVAVQHGSWDVLALTADTLIEDDDNWRFARQVIRHIGCRWVVLADGRTPMQVGRDEGIVPNNRLAVCSRILKRELLRGYIDAHFDPTSTVIYLGFDWTEPHRLDNARPHWEPFMVACPLMERPHRRKEELLDEWRSRGIEPPALYADGFAHANCGGGCVRSGQAQWELLLRKRPEVYAEWEAEEERSRYEIGKNVAILRDRRGAGPARPLTLRVFRERLQAAPALFDADDWGACGCVDDGLDPGIPSTGQEMRNVICREQMSNPNRDDRYSVAGGRNDPNPAWCDCRQGECVLSAEYANDQRDANYEDDDRA